MTTEHFNYLKQTVEFDLNMYITGMINSKKFNDSEIRDIGAYVGAHYTHFSKTQNLEVTESEKIALMKFISTIYSRFSKTGFSFDEQQKQVETYNQLMLQSSDSVQSKLQSITNIFIK